MSADPEFEALLGGVISSTDGEIAADPGCPDFAAMVARAHELDPQRIPAEAAAEVAQWAPVVSITQGHRRRRTRDDVEMLAVIESVRADVEQDVAERLGTPPPVAMQDEPRQTRKLWVMTFAAAAALVLVGVGVLQASRSQLERDPSRSEAALVSPARTSVPADRATAQTVEDESAVLPNADEMEVEPPTFESEAEVESESEQPVRKHSRSPRTPPTLEELDAMAHVAWRAGDLPEATRLFRRLAKRAGKDRLGDLAYGDLFTLARQRGARGQEVSLWREYLRRFPQGRFADDASAGLCRRAADEDQRKCWQGYLERMPEGSHRAQARRVVAELEERP